MNEHGARVFLIGFALLTILTLIQQLFHPIKLAGLQGAFDAGEKPEFSADLWFKGLYQQQSDHYLKYNTAFNGELVRLRNQADYSVFGNINTILTLGKENYIYDPNYIEAIQGTDYLSDSLRHEKTAAIEHTLELLKLHAVPLYVCLAPNKAAYYEEYLPTPLLRQDKTNRSFFQLLLKQKYVTVIDYDSWFLEMKDTSSYPLVPKYGAHWSTYGAFFAADSLFGLINSNDSIEYAGFSINTVELSDKARFTDDDYLASLNLMKKWKSPAMAYPLLNFHPGKKPNVLIISDSFIWNWYDLGIIQNCFSAQSQIRYYNKTIFDIHKKNLGPAGKLTADEVSDRDFILLLTSDPALKEFGFGIFEAAAQIKNHD